MSTLNLSQLKNKFYAFLASLEKKDPAPEVSPASNDTIISDSLCSQNLKNEDSYEANNIDRNTKISKEEIEKNREDIINEYDLDWFTRNWFSVRDFFGRKFRVDEQLKSYLESSNSVEEAYRKLIEEKYNGFKTEKDYKRFSERYGYGLLNLDPQMLNVVDLVAAGIGILNVDARANASKYILGKASTHGERNDLARTVQSHALSIVTKGDHLGNKPDARFALKFQKETYDNMDKSGISTSNAERDQMIDKIKRLKKIVDEGGTLSEEEQKWLNANNIDVNDIDAVYQNYIVAGYAGALAGITSNMYLTDADAQVFMNSISSTVQHYGIQAEVFSQVDEYYANNPDNKAIESRFASLAEIKIQAMQADVQSIPNATQENTETPLNNPMSEDQQAPYAPENPVSGNNKSAPVTNPVSNEVVSREVGAGNATKHSTYAETNNKSSSRYVTFGLSRRTRSDAKQSEVGKENHSKAPTEVDKTKALESVESYRKYMKEYDIGKVQACTEILNGASSSQLISYGQDMLDGLGESDQRTVVQDSDDGGKARAAMVVNLHILDEIEVSDAYAMKQIDDIRELRMGENRIQDERKIV